MPDLLDLFIVGATASIFLGRKEVPLVARFVGNAVGRVVGAVQGARLRIAEMSTDSELGQLGQEIRSNLEDIDVIKNELRATSAVSPGFGIRTTIRGVSHAGSASRPVYPGGMDATRFRGAIGAGVASVASQTGGGNLAATFAATEAARRAAAMGDTSGEPWRAATVPPSGGGFDGFDNSGGGGSTASGSAFGRGSDGVGPFIGPAAGGAAAAPEAEARSFPTEGGSGPEAFAAAAAGAAAALNAGAAAGPAAGRGAVSGAIGGGSFGGTGGGNGCGGAGVRRRGSGLAGLAMAELTFKEQGFYSPRADAANSGADIVNEAIADTLLYDHWEETVRRQRNVDGDSAVTGMTTER